MSRVVERPVALRTRFWGRQRGAFFGNLGKGWRHPVRAARLIFTSPISPFAQRYKLTDSRHSTRELRRFVLRYLKSCWSVYTACPGQPDHKGSQDVYRISAIRRSEDMVGLYLVNHFHLTLSYRRQAAVPIPRLHVWLQRASRQWQPPRRL